MKKHLFLVILVFAALLSTADEGDTLKIQTIDYDTPVSAGWNSPRQGTYLFPSEDVSFSKILMSYKLICDPSQSPACGEWDYLTYTKIWEHTGEFDSTMYTHPKFKVNNSAPDTFNVMNSPSFYYQASLEYSNQTTATAEFEIGSNNTSINLPFDDGSDGKAQFIYLASDLSAAGLTAGELTAMIINLSESIDFKHFKIDIKTHSDDFLPLDTLINYGFTTVFEKNISFESGDNQLDFSFPFNWDGTNNILLDISYAESNGSSEMAAQSSNDNETLVSAKTDNFLNFSGWDHVEVPAEVFETTDSVITITFWQYGDPIKQPMNNSIFHANDIDGNRILNAHLPWSNGQIYWDAGWDDGNDRINRSAPNASDYKGQWNHWAFSKNIESGSMRMYLNGGLFYLGSGKRKSMAGITEFFIGGANSANYYEGMIDDFCIWDTELEWPGTLQEWMAREIDETHPNYENLRAYYKFDEGSGTIITDHSQNNFHASAIFGQAEWMNYKGKNRHKHAIGMEAKPFVKLQNGDYNAALLDSIVVIDTFSFAANSIIFYDPTDPLIALDTILKWPEYYNNYVYDAGAIATDSTLVVADSILYNEEYIYYGEPFELLIPWEIGRYITPYGNNLSLGDGFTWVYDVTDYVSLLRDSVHISAGNFQELLDLEFHMIEGTPARDVLKIDKVYSGNYNLNSFEETVPPKTIALDPDASLWKIRSRTTGHAFDNPTNCAEFCNKIHSLSVDNQEVKSWQIIQECAENPLYPQGGTWIYDRAGWCPGMDVTEEDIEITEYVLGDEIIIDYNSQYDEYGNYVLETHLFSYSDYNFTTDATIVEIIAPNNLKRYGRFNPTITNPILVIQNLGSDVLTSVDIMYAPEGVEPKTYSWSGNLEPMASEEVILEAFEMEEWQIGQGKFSANLTNPNGLVDENTINDSYYTNYDEVDIYPGTIVIHLKTNKAAYQNYYEIKTSDGSVIFEKDNLANETTYIDTISLVNGNYDFYLYDSGDNGLSFWAETSQGNGSLKFYDLNGDKIKQFNGDFGDRIYNSFYADMYLGTNTSKVEDIAFNISPNPNTGQFTLSYALAEKAVLTISIYDSHGRKVHSCKSSGSKTDNLLINMGKQSSGVYSLSLEAEGMKTTKKFILNK